MNNGSFEKMDKEFLDNLKSVREKKVPESVRKDFKQSVEKRLFAAGQPAPFAFSFAVVPVLILGLGAALCWFYLRPNRAVPDNMQTRAEVLKAEQLKKETPPEVIVPINPKVPVKTTAETALRVPELPQVTESNLVAELEALKELGVWTEKDEEEIGISADQVFVELETLASEMLSGTNSVNPPQTAPQ